MNPAHLLLASDHCSSLRDALLEAHRDAINCGNGYAEVALSTVLANSTRLGTELARLVDAATHTANPDNETAFAEKVIKELESRGIEKAYWEFPGYISVRLTKRTDEAYLACGTANARWDCDLVTDHGGDIKDAGSPPVPITGTVVAVADLIEDCYNRHNLTPAPRLTGKALTDLIQRVADEFDIQIRTELGDSDYDQAVEDNNALSPELFESICHTHDHCDANMVMAAAIKQVLGREVETNNEWDTALWNAAWSKWKQGKKGGAA